MDHILKFHLHEVTLCHPTLITPVHEENSSHYGAQFRVYENDPEVHRFVKKVRKALVTLAQHKWEKNWKRRHRLMTRTVRSQLLHHNTLRGYWYINSRRDSTTGAPTVVDVNGRPIRSLVDMPDSWDVVNAIVGLHIVDNSTTRDPRFIADLLGVQLVRRGECPYATPEPPPPASPEDFEVFDWM